MRKRSGKILRNFLGHTGGIAVVEFAMMLPVLMALLYGCIEVTRFTLATQKAEKLAHAVADVTAQSTAVTVASLNQMLAATDDIMEPFDFAQNGVVFVTSLYRPQGEASAPVVNWRHMGGGELVATSAFGDVGATPTLPVAFAFDERENVIASEVYYQFNPLITSQFFGNTIIYRSAFYKPRFGLLTTTPG